LTGPLHIFKLIILHPK